MYDILWEVAIWYHQSLWKVMGREQVESFCSLLKKKNSLAFVTKLPTFHIIFVPKPQNSLTAYEFPDFFFCKKNIFPDFS